ncbi:MAG: hypothetical protein WCJ09_26840 [Planctomycetota bacterium]
MYVFESKKRGMCSAGFGLRDADGLDAKLGSDRRIRHVPRCWRQALKDGFLPFK